VNAPQRRRRRSWVYTAAKSTVIQRAELIGCVVRLGSRDGCNCGAIMGFASIHGGNPLTKKPSPEVVTFTLRSGTEPFKDDPPYADDFYNSLGRAVLMWGKLEQTIDDLVVTAINIASREAPAREFQLMLNRKLNLLRELYEQTEDLKPLRPDATALADRVKELGIDRHLVVHTNWFRFDDGPPTRIVGRHLAHKKGNITVKRAELPLADLARVAGAFHGAREETLRILSATNELIDPEIREKALKQAQLGDGHFLPIEL
jgi:hypothetical protein